MAESQRPKRKTASRCAPETDRCTHAFEIAGYSIHKGLGAGKFISSATFVVGGHDWRIRYYPGGMATTSDKGHVSVFVELMSKHDEVRALYELRLVNLATRQSLVIFSSRSSGSVFKFVNGKNTHAWGISSFMKMSDLEESPYLSDDRIIIECDLTVIKEPHVVHSTNPLEIQVPLSDLSDNLAKLLEAGEETNVTFKVKGEVFPAHKIVLAMRSPVFKAEFYGPMAGKREKNIVIEDMQPAVFKALLHFFYTDSFPPMDDDLTDINEKKEMVKHLLVAADRYAMERMKLMCESILCQSLDSKSVAATLALADQHHCSKLKDVCIQFINSSNMDDVAASEGYEHLKRACPGIFVDIWEKAAQSRKI